MNDAIEEALIHKSKGIIGIIFDCHRFGRNMFHVNIAITKYVTNMIMDQFDNALEMRNVSRCIRRLFGNKPNLQT